MNDVELLASPSITCYIRLVSEVDVEKLWPLKAFAAVYSFKLCYLTGHCWKARRMYKMLLQESQE